MQGSVFIRLLLNGVYYFVKTGIVFSRLIYTGFFINHMYKNAPLQVCIRAIEFFADKSKGRGFEPTFFIKHQLLQKAGCFKN